MKHGIKIVNRLNLYRLEYHKEFGKIQSVIIVIVLISYTKIKMSIQVELTCSLNKLDDVYNTIFDLLRLFPVFKRFPCIYLRFSF